MMWILPMRQTCMIAIFITGYLATQLQKLVVLLAWLESFMILRWFDFHISANSLSPFASSYIFVTLLSEL